MTRDERPSGAATASIKRPQPRHERGEAGTRSTELQSEDRAPDPAPPGPRAFPAVLESLPAAVYVTDAGGHITFFNEAAASLWGRRPELGKDRWSGAWRLYWSDGKPMAHRECPLAVTLRTGEPKTGASIVAERPDGTFRALLAYPRPLHNGAGVLTGAVNLLVDVTEPERHAGLLPDGAS